MVLLRPDVHQVGTISGYSQKDYRKAVRPFIEWLERHAVDPFIEELDDLAMEYKHVGCPDGKSRGPSGLTRSKFSKLLTALGHALPWIRSPFLFSVSFSASRGWLRMEPNRRTFPLPQ